MKKTLKLDKIESTYCLFDGSDKIIELNDLKLDMKQLYEKIYDKGDINDHVFDINVETLLTNKEDKYILDQLNLLFNDIKDAIIKQFASDKN